MGSGLSFSEIEVIIRGIWKAIHNLISNQPFCLPFQGSHCANTPKYARDDRDEKLTERARS